MSVRNVLVVVSLALSVAIGLALGRGASSGAADTTTQVTVGLSLDSLQEARWQSDRDMFVSRVKELGANVLVLAASGYDAVQIGDVEKLITNRVSVLVIVPHDGVAMARAVRLAHDAGIPVVAYDRLVRNSDLDLYVSFDNVKVGEQQARYLIDHLPTPGKGRIIRVYGGRTDNNASLVKEGQDRALAPYLERGDITVLHEDWAENWTPENAKRIVNAAITAKGRQFDAVLSSNDGMAGGIVQALLEEGLAGKVLVTGQDADTVALQRIATGTQAMTIYKPLKTLARGAAELAVRIGQRRVVTAPQTVNNGAIDVPSMLFPVITVTKDNILSTVVADGLATYDDVYRGVPDGARPPRP